MDALVFTWRYSTYHFRTFRPEFHKVPPFLPTYASAFQFMPSESLLGLLPASAHCLSPSLVIFVRHSCPSDFVLHLIFVDKQSPFTRRSYIVVTCIRTVVICFKGDFDSLAIHWNISLRHNSVVWFEISSSNDISVLLRRLTLNYRNADRCPQIYIAPIQGLYSVALLALF